MDEGKTLISGAPEVGRFRLTLIDPNKLTLKAPGTQPLKLKYDEVLSSFAFKFNLRCYTEGEDSELNEAVRLKHRVLDLRQGLTLVHFSAQPQPFCHWISVKTPSISHIWYLG